MGVQSLWTLLEPVGRRINIEALANKRLAVDASIWVNQFLKAMRNQQGEVIHNAHLLGFFRRICKLLFNKVRPVFVFDGATPALKRRTTIARRRRREQQNSRLKKTAEKLLMTQLKKHVLEQMVVSNTTSNKGAKASQSKAGRNAAVAPVDEEEPAGSQRYIPTADELRAQEEAERRFKESNAEVQLQRMDTEELLCTVAGLRQEADATSNLTKEEQHIIDAAVREEAGASGNGAIDVHAPPAVQPTAVSEEEEVVAQSKRKRASAVGRLGMQQTGRKRRLKRLRKAQSQNRPWQRQQQQRSAQDFDAPLDMEAEILADNQAQHSRSCSTSEQESGLESGLEDLDGSDSGSQGTQSHGEGEAEDDEEEGGEEFYEELAMADLDEVDPSVLSALAPSMQLNILQGMRDNQMRVNREGFQDRQGRPNDFSTFQVEQFLKASQFRRKVEDVKDAMNARVQGGPGGARSNRIASDTNREYILQVDDKAEEVLPRRRRSGGLGSGGLGSGQLGSQESSGQLPAPANLQQEMDAAAARDGRLAEAEVVKVELELPQGVGPDLLLAKSEDDEEWETVGASPKRDEDRQQTGSTGSLQAPQNWRARMIERQKFWSMSHGFQFGRKLADWGKDSDEGDAGSGNAGDVVCVDGETTNVEPEDAELQRAIHLSLQDDGRGSGRLNTVEEGSDDDLDGATANEWQPAADAHVAPGTDMWPRGRRRFQVMQPAVEEPRSAPKPEHQSEPARKVLGLPPAPTRTARATAPAMAMQPQSPAAQTSTKVERLSELDRAPEQQRADTGVEEAAAGPETDAAGPMAAEPEEDDWEEVEDPPDVQANANEASFDHTGFSNALQNSPPEPVSPFELASENQAALTPVEPSEPVQSNITSISSMSPQTKISALSVEALAHEQHISPPAELPAAQLPAESDQPEALLESSVPLSQGQEATGVFADAGRDEDEAAFEQALASQDLPTPSSQAMPGETIGPSAEAEPEEDFDVDAALAQITEETERLQQQQRWQKRAVDTPTNEMYTECQELLQLFGLPYIIAPSEAEAQCAWMDLAGLVDGVVTEDNDTFLFGASHVYRNIFSDQKYVEEYHTKDIEEGLGISREQLVYMALLLGSDYTEGIAGVGIVNAVEIVNAFEGLEGLRQFRDWVSNPDPQLLAAIGGTAADAGDSEAVAQFKRKHKGARRNWDLPESFPSTTIINAYFQARVDKNKDKVAFGRPDLELLRIFCHDKFGWPQQRCDELLLPVLKSFDDRQKQMTMDTFLSFRERFAKIRSKRLQAAVKGIRGGVEDSELVIDGAAAPKKRARTSPSKPRQPRKSKAAAAGKGGSTKGPGRGRGARAGRGRGRGRATQASKMPAGEAVSSSDEGRKSSGAQGNERDLRPRRPGVVVKDSSSGEEDAALPDGMQPATAEDSDGFVDF